MKSISNKTRLSGFPRIIFMALLMIAFLAQGAAFAKTISGTVFDQDGEPAIGATVMVKGTSVGTSTDISGNFTIANVADNAVLEVRYVGCQPATVETAGKTNVEITLKADNALLDEVVVVGYGVQKKSDVTGAMTSLSAKDLQTRPVSNAFEALQGKAAGVDITTNERPGTVGSVRIRGERSLKAGNDPLYVVDGVPLMSGSGIETLNPRDIESIDILKDASATAIYGSRGANGVILVTTKQGKAGQFSLNYSGSVTWQNLVDRNKNMNAADDIEYRRWAAYNSDPTKYADPRNPTKESDQLLFSLYGDNTALANVMRGWSNGTWNPALVENYNWQDKCLRTGFVQEHTISASGGTEKMNAFGSFGYLSNKGTQKGQEYNRYTARVGMSITPVKWMTINMSINASREFQDYGMSSWGQPSSTNGVSQIYALYKKGINYTLPYDENGNRVKYPGGGGAAYSTINEWEHNISERETYRVLGSFSANLHIGEIIPVLKGLDYKIAFGPDYRNWRQGDFADLESAYMINKSATMNTTRWQQRRDFSWTLDNMITYNRTFDRKHNVGVTLLQTASKWNFETANMEAQGLDLDSFRWNNMGSVKIDEKNSHKVAMGSGIEERQLESYMIRLNYGFDEKYLITASGRWDGASQLSKGHKWAFFPSVALGWRIQQEEFMKNIEWINNLKLRVGVGTTGNSAIAPYSTLNLLQTIYIPTGTGYEQGFTLNEPTYFKDNLVMSNTKVGWEKTTQWNLGVDYGFLNNRINGSLEFYWSKTNDLLLSMIVPTVTGYSSTTANVGKTSNHGIELTLTAIPVETRDFNWTTSFNMGWQKDRIDELAYGKNDDVSNAWFIGESLSVWYDYKTDGLWQDTPEDQAEMAKWNENGYKFTPGMVKPVDTDDNYKMDGNDRVILGNKRPTLTAGWMNTLTYKGIDLSFQMYGRFNYMVNAPQYLFGYGNIGKAADYWTPDNKNAEYQKPILTSEQTGSADVFAKQHGYKKANFVRMRNISVGYTFPRKLIQKATLQNLKVYAQVINPFDIYQSVNGLDLDTGNSFYNRSWVIGLEIGF